VKTRLALLALVALAACSADTPTAPTADLAVAGQASAASDRIALCHRSGSGGVIIDVSPAAVAAHEQHGDYLTALAVSHTSSKPDDDTHFHRIGDALAAARAGRLARGEGRSAACRITITVGPGVFHGTGVPTGKRFLEVYPLMVDVPDITLRGALVMEVNGGRATGKNLAPIATTLALQPEADGFAGPLIVANAHPSGSAGHGLTVEGFAFESGNGGGFAVLSMRVRRLVIQGNRFEAGFGVTLDLRATHALLARNEMSGTIGCDMCLSGPGVYQVTGNRLLGGLAGHEGVIVAPVADLGVPAGVEPFVLPAFAAVSADIGNNEVRHYRLRTVSAAIRLVAGGPGDVAGSTHVTVHDNLLVNNMFGVILDAGFPTAGTKLRGDMDLTLGHNDIRRSCQTDLFMTFSRHATGLGLGEDPYLLNSTYRLTLGGNLRFSDAWFDNPPGFGNTLIVNGAVIGHRTRRFFDAVTCPGTGEPVFPTAAAQGVADDHGTLVVR
jgi:hypothetical protein